MEKENAKTPVSDKVIKNEIFSLFCIKASRINCASVVINRDELPFVPHRAYDIQQFINKELVDEAKRKGFTISDKSDNFQLVFKLR